MALRDFKCHSMIREIIEEEIAERKWTQPALIISALANTSISNAERILRFDTRLTRVECWMLDKAFGMSDGFFFRLQRNCETRYPEK